MAADGSIVIKKIKKGGGHGHHGGAWKVAYADFVTAMMAFFLLMWLINTTTPEQKRGIADYFAPSAASRSESGAGGILGGQTVSQDGAKSAGQLAVPLQMKKDSPEATGRNKASSDEAASGEPSRLRGRASASERRGFEMAASRLRQALQEMPELAELSKHVLIDQTDEGMRIQLVDQDGRSMFEPGSAEPNARTQQLLSEVAKHIQSMPNRVSITGHTDGRVSNGQNGYGNWELSAGRANASRRVLEASGVPASQIATVAGKAGTEPLYPDNPFASANRRISILLLSEIPALPPGIAP